MTLSELEDIEQRAYVADIPRLIVALKQAETARALLALDAVHARRKRDELADRLAELEKVVREIRPDLQEAEVLSHEDMGARERLLVLESRAVLSAVSWRKAEEELAREREKADALVNALQHCIDLGPPCPSCGAEDEEMESDGLYPHVEDCQAWAALRLARGEK